MRGSKSVFRIVAAVTPRHARIAVSAFVLLSAGVAGNIMFFQDTQVGGKPRAERGVQRSAFDPARRTGGGSAAEAAALSSGLAPVVNAQSAVAAPASATKAGARSVVDPMAAASGDAPEVIASIQRELQARGYEPGTPDGVAGTVTRAAIMAWESDHGLALTGEPTEAVMKAIVLGVSAQSAAQIAAQWQALPKDKRARAEQMMRMVQQSLSALGYNLGKVTGRMNDDTERAIREFETDQNMTPRGRVSGPLVARLARLTAAARPATAR